MVLLQQKIFSSKTTEILLDDCEKKRSLSFYFYNFSDKMGTLVETDIDHFIRERKAKLHEERRNFTVCIKKK